MTPLEIQYVDDAIASTVARFRQTPNVFLTEDDLRLHLSRDLLRHFGSEEQTNDGDTSISLHSEVRWYGFGDLKIRSDIVLVDVASLDVRRSTRMPSKGFNFNIAKAIIELKLRRSNGPSNPEFQSGIQNDLTKLRKLSGIFCEPRQPFSAQFWMVVFDKKEHLRELPRAEEGIRLIYEFSDRSEPRP